MPFDKMDVAGANLGTGQAQFVESRNAKKQAGKKKGGGGTSKGCAQS